MSNELPQGWASTRLREVVLARKGKKPNSLQEAGLSDWFPYLLIDQMEGKPARYFTNDSKVTVAEKEDVLVVWDGSIGKCTSGLVGAVGSTIVALKPIGISTGYLEAFIKYIQPVLQQTSRGTGLQHINQKVFWDLEVPIAPHSEQCRIQKKLDDLSVKIDDFQKRLAKVPVIIKRFRQSVLNFACAGRLTADWREQNRHIETAGKLIGEEPYQIRVTVSELTGLPDTWKWVALGNYGRCSRGRFSIRPRNDPKYFGGKHPFIQIGNLPVEGGWINSHTQTLNEKGLAVSKKFPKGTAVIAIVGATIGNTGLLAYDMCFTDSMVGIATGTIEGNRYVELFLQSKKNEIRQASYSSGGQPNINLEVLNPYPLALPPLAEQQEIVRRVEALLALADKIESRYAKAKAHVDKVSQSILAKAFRGELVPQDPNDESATVLLERLRTERMSGTTETQKRNKSKLSKPVRKKRISRRPVTVEA